jgi:S-DNA-T family DNA segregation ATPase FtsK/SpoIIIE
MRGFGISSFLLSGLLFLSGVYVALNLNKNKLLKHWIWGFLIVIWCSVLLGFFTHKYDFLGGVIGFEINHLLQDYIGKIGTILVLLFGLISYAAIRFKITGEQLVSVFRLAKKDLELKGRSPETGETAVVDNSLSDEAKEFKAAFEIPLDRPEPTISNHSTLSDKTENLSEVPKAVAKDTPEIDFKVEDTFEESEVDEKSKQLVEDFGQFDPTLELGKYQFPKLELLKKYDNESIAINQEELEENKNRIVETLNNYKIGIASIKATIGPTVTLYEIVPEAGIRISKIKNLEDDIALSLSALGIRIIAPIPGKAIFEF